MVGSGGAGLARPAGKGNCFNPRLCGSLCRFYPKEVWGTSFLELNREKSWLDKLLNGVFTNPSQGSILVMHV